MDVPARCGQPGPTQRRSPHVQAFAPLWCAVSQVVKTAQSRGRTERTLLSAGTLAGAPRPAGTGRNAADRLDPSLLMSHYGLLHPTHHADKWPVVGGRCTCGAHRCKAKQGCREDRSDVWILASKIVRFLGRVESESCPTQDEPEGRACFQYKMSLRDKAC
jgi:hypothetical protein